jgi:hypothetical protein
MADSYFQVLSGGKFSAPTVDASQSLLLVGLLMLASAKIGIIFNIAI